MRERFSYFLNIISRPTVAIGGALIIGVLLVGFAWYSTSVSPSGDYTPVAVGSITEEVDVSSTVNAAHDTDLSFQTSGRVAAIRVDVGNHVGAGQTLVALDGSIQSAAVALAQANLEAQKAKLASLMAGTRPEQLAINKTNVAQAENALTSARSSAYMNADDAVHTKADQIFSNPRSSNAELVVLVPDMMLSNKVQNERVALEPVFTTWNTSLTSTNDIENLAASSETNLRTVASFLDDLTTALAKVQPGGSISAATLSGYQTSVNAGRLNVSSSLAALISADTAYKAAEGALTLAQAGATQNDIDAQKAAVDAAQASVAAADAAAGQTVIAAPVSGTITAQNANLGETVVPGVPLISMIADGKYQADAQISEADIAKIKVNDTVSVTFAEYPDATFPATVTTVNPAATTNGNATFYGITVTFINNDSRLKPGLSANLHIITATKDSVLIVPTSAVITDGNQKFVYVKNAKGILKTSVTTGIEGVNGMIEIVSGLSQGDNVLSFGAGSAQ